MKHYKGLDTLRALAVIFVIKFHWGPVYDDKDPIKRFIKEIIIPDGGFGVFLFFVLSGFLITSILLNAKVNSNKNSYLLILKNFVIRRALRIFPIYYLLIFLLYRINYDDVRVNLWWFLTYTNNILCYTTNTWDDLSHIWTLCIEEQVYLIWPWLILFIKDKYYKYLFLACIFIGIASTYWVIIIHHGMGPMLVFNCFDSFGLGGFYAYVRLKEEKCRQFEKIISRIIPFVFLFYFYLKLSYLYHFPTYGIYLSKIVVSLISIWIIIKVLNNKSPIIQKYFLENRILNFIGMISYGMYLYHNPVTDLYDKYYVEIYTFFGMSREAIDKLVQGVSFQVILFPALVLISWVSYVVIEKPILRLKKLFEYNN